jgi:hypothetical protein
MFRIGRGIELGQQGGREAARRRFAQLWAEIGSDGDTPAPLRAGALDG